MYACFPYIYRILKLLCVGELLSATSYDTEVLINCKKLGYN